eukprot:1162090-Pelagomonas_calceolata.AAC.13
MQTQGTASPKNKEERSMGTAMTCSPRNTDMPHTPICMRLDKQLSTQSEHPISDCPISEQNPAATCMGLNLCA